MKNRLRSKDFRQNIKGKRDHMKIVDKVWGKDDLRYLIQCCDKDFTVRFGDYEASCPICGQTLRIASLRRDWEEK